MTCVLSVVEVSSVDHDQGRSIGRSLILESSRSARDLDLHIDCRRVCDSIPGFEILAFHLSFGVIDGNGIGKSGYRQLFPVELDRLGLSRHCNRCPLAVDRPLGVLQVDIDRGFGILLRQRDNLHQGCSSLGKSRARIVSSFIEKSVGVGSAHGGTDRISDGDAAVISLSGRYGQVFGIVESIFDRFGRSRRKRRGNSVCGFSAVLAPLGNSLRSFIFASCQCDNRGKDERHASYFHILRAFLASMTTFLPSGRLTLWDLKSMLTSTYTSRPLVVVHLAPITRLVG